MSSGQKPTNQTQKKRHLNAHTTIQESLQASIPFATNLQKGVEITIAKNLLGTLKIPHGDSGSKNEIPIHGDCYPSQNVSPIKKSVNSTVGIITNDQLNIPGQSLTGNGVPAGQIENSWYQKAPIDKRNSVDPSILYGYQSTASILQSLHLVSSTSSGDRQKATFHSGLIGMQQPILDALTSSKEKVGKVIDQSYVGNDQHSQRKNS